MTENELYHHGILGMKWGVRRYQNKDGSLTPRGRKRLERLEGEAEKLRPKKKEEAAPPKSAAAARHPEVEGFDDEELKAKNNRLNMEKQYDSFFPQEKPRTPAPDPGIDTYKRSDASKLSNEEIQSRIERIKLEKQYTDLLPEERSKGKIFVEDMLKPAIYNQGKKLTEDVLSKGREVLGQYLGKKVESSLKSKLGIKEDQPDDPSTYRFEDMRKLSTKELKDRNERIDAENKYTKFFKDQAQANDNSNTGGNDGGGNNSGKKNKNKSNDGGQTKTLNEPTRNEDDGNLVKKGGGIKGEKWGVREAEKDYTNDAARPLVKVEKPITARISEWSRHDEGMSGGKVTRREASLENLAKGRDAIKAKREASAAEAIRKAEESAMMERAKSFVDRFDFDEEYKKLKHSDTEDLKMEAFYSDELYHHGVKGQKWGVRRYQNADGTLTADGRKRVTAMYARTHLNQNDQKWTYARSKQERINKKLLKKGFEDIEGEAVVPKRYTGSDKSTLKLVKKYNALEKEMKRLDKNTWSILSAAVEKKFDVTSKPVQRIKSKGQYYTESILFGVPLATILTSKTEGEGYYVRKKGSGKISLMF